MSPESQGPGGGRGRRWGPTGRPPWWPEGEAWPPAGGPPWRRFRRRFMWRAALLFAAAVFLLALLMTAVIALVAGPTEHFGPPRFFGFFWFLVLLALIVFAVRGVRRVGRVALDVGELIEAAGRIEAGGVRMQGRERGPA